MEKLIQYIKRYSTQGLCIAFSGGVDSSVILKATCIAHKNEQLPILAVTFETKLHPHPDIEEAKKLALSMGAIHQTIIIDEFSDKEINKNPLNRCYLCKKLLFQTLQRTVQEKGYTIIFDGSNLDDTKTYRPGLKALKELGIISPFIDLKITKEKVRQLASAFHLSTANKPSTPCLATRLPYHTALDYPLLNKLYQGETYIRNLGFYNVRLRFHHPIIRIEVDLENLSHFLSFRSQIVDYLKNLGFIYITLDLEGFRSGSMDIDT